jgi:hypothetical protein
MKKIYFPLIVFVASFVYYAIQSCPTFYFWDSAELTAAVLGGGVPHPPGFPALLLLAKLWTAIMPMDKAYSLNLLSAFFASLGLTFWYLLGDIFFGRVFSGRRQFEITIFSLLSALILGISFSFSLQAVRFEVYSFNFACFAALAYLAVKLSIDTKKNSAIIMPLFVLTAIAALGGHHFTIALAFPGLLLLLFLHNRHKLKHLLYFLAAGLLILIPIYYYIFFLAQKDPILNWGAPSDWSGFIDYFLLKEFSTPLTKLAPAHLAQNLGFAVEIIVKQTGVLGFVLGLWGIIRLIRVYPRITLPLMAILIPNVFSIIYFEDFFFENYDQHGYLLFSIAIFALFTAAATGFLAEYLINRLGPKMRMGNGGPRVAFMIALAAIIIFSPAVDNLFSADLSRITAARDFAGLFLEEVPDNSILISSSYNTYFCLLAYDAAVKHEGNILITNVYNWDHDWGRRQTAARLSLNAAGISIRPDFYRNLLNEIKDERPVYVEFDKASAPLVKYLKPAGLAYKFSISDTSGIDADSAAAEIENYYQLARKSRDLESIRIWVLWFMNRGQFFMKLGENDLSNWYFEVAEKIGSQAEIK